MSSAGLSVTSTTSLNFNQSLKTEGELTTDLAEGASLLESAGVSKFGENNQEANFLVLKT